VVSIARKNTFRERGRLLLTVLGLGAAVTLILFSLAMANGTLRGTLLLPGKAGAEVWVLGEGMDELVTPSAMPEGAMEAVRAVPGVAEARGLTYQQRKAVRGGADQQVVVLGVDVEAWQADPGFAAGAPWSLRWGEVGALTPPGTAIVDETLLRGLGSLAAGDTLTLDGQEVRVVGVSTGARSFIYPFVFVSLETARVLAAVAPPVGSGIGLPGYILIRSTGDVSAEELAAAVRSQVPAVNALPAGTLQRNTLRFMLFESGMGAGIGAMAVVGILIAALIAALTLYTATMDRVPEYGVLKAMGADRAYLRRVLLAQMFWTVTLGYAAGTAGAYAVSALVDRVTTMPAVVPVAAVPIGYVAVLGLSAAACLTSARRVNRIDPAIVFKS